MKRTMFYTIVSLGVFLPSVSYAYVDPGSGSVIVTTILGFAAAVGYTCRKYFYKIKRRLIGAKSETDVRTSEESGSID